jgi:hypothetical protein
VCNQYHIGRKTVVPYSPWRNLAEASIRELKAMTRRFLRSRNAPRRLRCYAGQYAASIRRLCALDIPVLQGRTPAEFVLGSTPDISSYCLFDFYEPVRTHEPNRQFPDHKMSYGRFVGIADSSEAPLSYLVLQKSGKVIVRKSIWGISDDDLKHPAVIAGIAELDECIQRK